MNFNIERAWKDEVYFNSLSEEERALLPECPVGAVDLDGDDMDLVHGTTPFSRFCSNGCLNSFSGGGCNSNNGSCNISNAVICAQSFALVCISNGNC
ncbi:MAG: mersacidin/lichenicidin family type 2 lantibiotic [Chloroflexi bacterium]|nr:mersacidin/lichenicidin family type 2 lantibiotic [Ktedonobacteraceae bacterium]MBV8821397.1 mersacidin/lichenicidin family type 2 lantibiotic [Ktedonobacteraceae bacterium]MBV9021787.1 mersacidin/lichenicidin family type 2 lantibiotic [Ktedonobacteraceae bacterium]MBV9705914.1 mersacidin/lichenicidin family type 2 lantibiotic [Chloroflexota bacterium]